MIKFYFTSLFILFFSFGFSQSYPYLNASTGNENEFPVDKDTNIYMFHGNRLVKTDKNFNTIWANAYSGITFSSLLLSKTGSIFFVSSNSGIFGKINANGSLAWVKNSTSVIHKIYLERNDNLILTGGTYGSGGYLIKTDTNGVGLKQVNFTGMYSTLGDLSIVTDSAGHYKLFGLGLKPLGGFSLGMLTFSDATNTFTNIRDYSLSSSFYNLKWKFVRSKLNNSFYARVSADLTPVGFVNFVLKFSLNGNIAWGEPINLSGFYWRTEYLEDDQAGNVFTSMSNYSSGSTHTSFIIKIDSSGVINGTGYKMLSNYPIYNPMTSGYEIPSHASRVIHENNYYFDISKYNFPTNPLTIQKFNSSFSFPCVSTLTVSGGSIGASAMMIYTPTITLVPSFTIAAFSSTVSAVSFSVDPNFCIVMKVGEESSADNELKIYPNPANSKLSINVAGQYINAVEIYDINGKKIRTLFNTSSAEVNDLPNGIYFIRIKTDKGEFNKKFIKE